MEEHDKPISDLASAKAYFWAMDGSHFHMSRENTARYSEYKSLNISKVLELEWNQELFDDYHRRATDSATDREELWWIHNRMEEIAKRLKSLDTLERLHAMTLDLESKLTPRGKLLVAETINGRSDVNCRSGLIFWSYDFNRVDLAESFASTAIRFSRTASARLPSETERCDHALKLTLQIREKLQI